MNRSHSKIRHIEKSNLILENRVLGRKPLLEYDIEDQNMSTAQEELNSIAPDISALMPELNLSSVKDAAQNLASNTICQIGDDVPGFVERNFGKKIREMFPDKAQEVITKFTDSISKFIDYIFSLKLSDLKSLLKTLKSKIAGKNSVVSEEIIKEFFGTSMAIITIGTFSMPALVLSIAAYVITGIIVFAIIRAILCSFNINITSIKNCRVRSFSWGQCN
jgi:hypothetical protein